MSVITLKALGLNSSPNALTTPDGSLVEASNVIIQRDDVISSRRGLKLDGDSFGTTNDRLKQLFVYKQRILRHFASTLQFESGTNNDGTRAFSDFNSTVEETQDGLRIKSLEANGNFYFTASDGIKKISASVPSQLSTAANQVTKAGGIKAIDLETELKITDFNQTGFLPQDSAVAYRVVWGKRDNNNNLILGAPSQRSEVYNSIITLMLNDFARLLNGLDQINQSGSLVTDGDYVSTLLLPAAASASELKANVIALATKLDTDILLANDSGTGAALNISNATISATTATITFTADPTSYISVGSTIYTSGFVPPTTVGDFNGLHIVTAVDSGAKTISFTTTATGTPVVFTAGEIYSGEFRYIVNSGTTDYPTPLADLVLSTIATAGEQAQIQNTVDRIIIKLQSVPTTWISSVLSTAYIIPLDITTTATVDIIINIPSEVTLNVDFYQIYRSSIAQATGTTVLLDLTPSDEMQLVYEAYPSQAEITAKVIEVEDVTPDAFRGANLYTNEATGEGALQSNDSPPFAKDINFFKNSTFFANTKTKHRKLLSLLGVSDLISDYNLGTTPQITISDGTTTSTYNFVTGLEEITTVTTIANSVDSLNGKYFTLNTAYDRAGYYFWYKSSGTAAVDPAVAGRTGVEILINTGDADTVVASKTQLAISTVITGFTATVLTNVVTVTNIDDGPATNGSAGTSGFTVTVTQAGRGEDATINQVLLSTAVSPAIAVDETAKSLVRVINKNSSSTVYAFYLSGAQSVPGQMLFEGKNLSNSQFYLLSNNETTGVSFNPDISGNLIVNTIAAGAPTANLVTTSTAHGLLNGDSVMLAGTTTTPVVDGLYEITYVSSTTFRINATITVADLSAPAGVAIAASLAESSSNEVAVNRIYFSKANQPESVPIVNYFDVGAGDKEILRIFPLRDSLFIFKQDGLYRLSGEVLPFSQALFDSSCILIAPDSLAVVNSEIYAWTTQGVSKVSEGGVTPAMSRPIDTEILKLSSPQYTTFKTSTFGVGYESDNAYLVWTVLDLADTVAMICYRYCTLTNTWTTFDIASTCGLVSSIDDRLYIGAADTNYMEQERKTFDRYDYADRELSYSLIANNYFGTSLKFSNVDDIEIGDVFVQDQTVTAYEFNMLLKRLDSDPGTVDKNYFATLEVEGGDNLRTKLLALAAKLDADTGVASTTYLSSILSRSGTITASSVATATEITAGASHSLLSNRYVTISGSNTSPTEDGDFNVTVTAVNKFTIPLTVTAAGTTGTWATADSSFEDIKACFNIIIDILNNDSGVSFSNYASNTNNTSQEAIVTAINTVTKRVTLNVALDFVVGPLTLFKAIESTFTYSPQTMGDPLGWKHLSEATVMFQNKAFTRAKLSFSTDLLPEFIEVPFSGRGNGIFGHSTFGSGFFGGASNAAPFRTYVPRNCQRCRYINVKFTHKTAREMYAIYGATLTGEVNLSPKAYKS